MVAIIRSKTVLLSSTRLVHSCMRKLACKVQEGCHSNPKGKPFAHNVSVYVTFRTPLPSAQPGITSFYATPNLPPEGSVRDGMVRQHDETLSAERTTSLRRGVLPNWGRLRSSTFPTTTPAAQLSKAVHTDHHAGTKGNLAHVGFRPCTKI